MTVGNETNEQHVYLVCLPYINRFIYTKIPFTHAKIIDALKIELINKWQSEGKQNSIACTLFVYFEYFVWSLLLCLLTREDHRCVKDSADKQMTVGNKTNDHHVYLLCLLYTFRLIFTIPFLSHTRKDNKTIFKAFQPR